MIVQDYLNISPPRGYHGLVEIKKKNTCDHGLIRKWMNMLKRKYIDSDKILFKDLSKKDLISLLKHNS